ncbi:hypothetical protein BDA96_10G083300 [Sorghum bicolor]|uniref:Uncharacterized protein n=1 Tax=Sorghum bicolor TaxID=4558 RepID=A0A921U0B7_SORBI|nr:hypothetical protein BDA96_10G083300 [Sorghum bicolor]
MATGKIRADSGFARPRPRAESHARTRTRHPPRAPTYARARYPRARIARGYARIPARQRRTAGGDDNDGRRGGDGGLGQRRASMGLLERGGCLGSRRPAGTRAPRTEQEQPCSTAVDLTPAVAVQAPPPPCGPLPPADRAPSRPDRAPRPRTDLRRHWIDLRHREIEHRGHQIDLRRCRIELRGEAGQAATGDPNAPKGSWRGEARRGEASGRCEASLASGGRVRRMRGTDGRGATVAGGVENWDGKP